MAVLLVLVVVGVVVAAKSMRNLAPDSTNQDISMIILVSFDVRY